jgi:hypothetical protein
MELLLPPLAMGLIVYIGISICHSLHRHKTLERFQEIHLKCTHCNIITPFIEFKYVKIYHLLSDDVIESYFLCPKCQAQYKAVEDLPLYSYKDQLIQDDWRNMK